MKTAPVVSAAPDARRRLGDVDRPEGQLSMAASESRREWTQADILGETMKRHAGDVGLFNALADITDEVFGDALNQRPAWQFPMGNITVGELLDF